jgi:peptide/nickel transport system ATP-binding protein
MLRVDGLRKTYRAGWFAIPFEAVDDVSFEIAPGESLALIGESGSGKTTVARMVSRLLQPSAGRILFEGQDIGSISPRAFIRNPSRHLIQHVFQDASEALTPHLTAFEAIADPLRRLKHLADPTARVLELAEAVLLPADLLGRYPHQLSGGQRARVGIARALAPEPRLLVLDEPTASLDVSVQAGILKLLDELRTRLKLGFLLVTHDLEVVRLTSSRVVLIQEGKAVEAGPTAEFLSTPKSPYGRMLLQAAPRLALVSDRADGHSEHAVGV